MDHTRRAPRRNVTLHNAVEREEPAAPGWCRNRSVTIPQRDDAAMETASRVGFALLSREASFFALPGKGLKAASPAPLRATSPDPSRGAVRRRRVCAAQPVTHPVDRLPFLEEARPPVIVTAPADGPSADHTLNRLTSSDEPPCCGGGGVAARAASGRCHRE